MPGAGQELAVSVGERQDLHVEDALRPDDAEVVQRVAASTGLSHAEASRVVADVVSYFAEPAEDFVRRRHAHLKTYGMKNPEIFVRIGAELRRRVVAAPPLTDRQLRRIVYG